MRVRVGGLGFGSFGSGNALDWIVGTRNHEGMSQSGTGSWRCGLGGVWRCSVVGDPAFAFAVVAAPSKINRALQSLVIFSSIFALKMFAPNLNRYALTYCNRNANATETNTVSQSSRRRSNLNDDEPYAVRSNLTVIQNSIASRCTVAQIYFCCL